MSLGKQLVGLGGFLGLCFAAAGIGGFASRDAPTFYALLHQPGWAPPAWLFGPVWTVLYTLMAAAAWLVWRRVGWDGAKRALSLFTLQLALNALWPWTFFGWHHGLLSTAVIVVLWAMIGATVREFWLVSRAAGALMAPYLAWVTYAGALNYALWRANLHLL